MGEVRACVFIDCEAKHPSAFLSECVVVPQVCTAVRGVQVTGPCGVLKDSRKIPAEVHWTGWMPFQLVRPPILYMYMFGLCNVFSIYPPPVCAV